MFVKHGSEIVTDKESSKILTEIKINKQGKIIKESKIISEVKLDEDNKIIKESKIIKEDESNKKD